jgi:hypothetical protein
MAAKTLWHVDPLLGNGCANTHECKNSTATTALQQTNSREFLWLGQFGNPEEEKRPLLEAATKQRSVKIVTD